MSEDSSVQSSDPELHSRIVRLEADVRLVINHLMLVITHLSDYATDKIDGSALRSRVGSIKDELRRR
jgi:hypothetical protein